MNTRVKTALGRYKHHPSPSPTATVSPTPSASPTASPSPTTSPGHVQFGIFSKLPNLTPAQSVAQRESQLGRTFAIDNHYYDWADSFPGSAESADVAAGRTPMDTWWGTDLTSITSGSQDGVINARAATVKSFAKPVYIRWGAEMNGNWYAWSGPLNGNDPSKFVAAWRHIHDLFSAAGVTNAIWVWAPNADSHPGGVDVTSWNNWRNYYPGDGYVDWVGIDGYNWGTPTDTWQTFGQIFAPVYNDYAARKPVMVAETSSVESGGSKAAWITDMSSWIKSHPALKALCWFDTNESSTGIDWRIDSSTTSFDAFKTVASDPYFSG